MWRIDVLIPFYNLFENVRLTKNTHLILNRVNNIYVTEQKGKTLTSCTQDDLAICDPALYLDFSWQVHDDLCESDHLPIILKKLTGTTPDNPQHWKLAKADWGIFTSHCHEHLNYDDLVNLPDPVEGFSSALLSIADKTIPKTSSTPKKTPHTMV